MVKGFKALMYFNLAGTLDMTPRSLESRSVADLFRHNVDDGPHGIGKALRWLLDPNVS